MRSFESLLTPLDHEFFAALAELDRAIRGRPKPVVSMEMYLAAVAANEFVVAQNRVLRRQRKRLVRLARERSRHVRLWRWAATMLLIVVLFGGPVWLMIWSVGR